MNFIKKMSLVLLLVLVFQPSSSETLGLNLNTLKQISGISFENTNASNLGDCIKVSVSTDSTVIVKDSSFMITIEIANQSKDRVNLHAFPIVYLQKAGITDAEKGVWGNLFYTVVNLPAESEFVKKEFLEPYEKIDFEMDITKSDWGHSIQSMLPSSNIFTLVPKGDYDLYVELPFNYSENGKKKIKNSISDSLRVSHEESK